MGDCSRGESKTFNPSTSLPWPCNRQKDKQSSVLPSLASLFREILRGVSGLLARNKEFIAILICVVICSVVKFLLTLVREVASIFFTVTFIAILICVVICSIVAGLLILVCDIFFSVTMLLLSETIRTVQTVSRYLVEDSWDDQQKPKRD